MRIFQIPAGIYPVTILSGVDGRLVDLRSYTNACISFSQPDDALLDRKLRHQNLPSSPSTLQSFSPGAAVANPTVVQTQTLCLRFWGSLRFSVCALAASTVRCHPASGSWGARLLICLPAGAGMSAPCRKGCPGFQILPRWPVICILHSSHRPPMVPSPLHGSLMSPNVSLCALLPLPRGPRDPSVQPYGHSCLYAFHPTVPLVWGVYLRSCSYLQGFRSAFLSRVRSAPTLGEGDGKLWTHTGEPPLGNGRRRAGRIRGRPGPT